MMRPIKVLPYESLPAKLPVTNTILLYLLLEHLNSPGWVCGVSWTLIVIVWICQLLKLYTQIEIKPEELK